MSLRIDLKASLRPNVNLSHYCTMQVGGPARYFADPSTEEELLELLDFARQENMPYFIMGKGSNLVFSDEGFDGLVISLIHFEQDKIIFDEEAFTLLAGSGIYLYRLVLAARDRGLGGTEFLCNVPGTVGGAVMMNAGFSRFPGQFNEIGDLIEEVATLTSEGKKEILTRKDLQFSYRHSNLAGRIVLSAKLKLWKRKREEIQNEIRANFDYRNKRQDLRHPSSGSVFKNPGPGQPSAAKIIDELGLKGLKVGGAMVSERHANYIINTGSARSADVIDLIRKVQQTVFDARKILLEPEVRIVEKP